MRRPSNDNDGSTTSIGGTKKSSNGFSVRFEETTSGDIHTKTFDPTHSQDSTLWLDQKEWADIRIAAKEVTEYVQDGDFIWSQARRSSYTKTMKRVYKSCVKGKGVTGSLKEELQFWTSIGHSRRGLEKYTLENVQVERFQRRRQVIESVLFVQDQCWDVDMDYDHTSRLLRVASEKFAKIAKHFAWTLAAADSMAADRTVTVVESKVEIVDATIDANIRVIDKLVERKRRTPSPGGSKLIKCSTAAA